MRVLIHLGRMLFSLRVGAACIGIMGIASAAACGGDDSGNGSFNDGTKDGGSSGNADSGGGFGNGTSDGGTPALPCTPDPGNAEIAGNNCDDDGDGKIDNVAVCDGSLAIDGDATAFAQAMGICDSTANKSFGLVSAIYTRGYGITDGPQSDMQHGILPKFGSVIVPGEGSMLGVLSSGYAREYDGPSGTGSFNTGKDWGNYGTGNTGKPGNGAAPSGFPKKAAGCEQNETVNDTIDVKLTLKVPPNAHGFTFDLNFWSGEWPNFVCSPYNDAFIAYVTSQALTDNISIDPKGNPISVNANFLDRCTPNSPVGCATAQGAVPGTAACGAGIGELAGTGFAMPGFYCDPNNMQSGGASTGWLTSTASVNPGETFTLELIIWDAGDGVLDSSVLLDKFRWTPDPVGTGTSRPVK